MFITADWSYRNQDKSLTVIEHAILVYKYICVVFLYITFVMFLLKVETGDAFNNWKPFSADGVGLRLL